jgi:hypothetical protein
MGKSKLIDTEISKDVILNIQHFLLNVPATKFKQNLWELFSGWVHFIDEAADRGEISEMLLFYEQLIELVETMSCLTPKTRKKVIEVANNDDE